MPGCPTSLQLDAKTTWGIPVSMNIIWNHFQQNAWRNWNHCAFRLISWINNSIFTDQFIESTYIRLGHEPGVQPTLQWIMFSWQNSHLVLPFVVRLAPVSITLQMTTLIWQMYTKRKQHAESTQSARNVRAYGGPLHWAWILWIMNSTLMANWWTLWRSVTWWHQCTWCFANKWWKCSGRAGPCFFDKLSNPILTMDDKKTHVILSGKKLYDQDIIYAWIVDLMSSNTPAPCQRPA